MNRRKPKYRSDEALTEARQTGVRMRREGYTAKAIAAVLEVHPNTVYRWESRVQGTDDAALKVLKRGRKLGEKRHLNPAQERDLQQRICQTTPETWGLPFALWTRRAVQALIEQETRVAMPIRTVGLYLQRWGFTPQKPLQKAYEQDPQAVAHWLEHDYPAIAARAQAEGAEIHWGDETAIEQKGQREKGYAPPGQPPVLRKPAKKLRLHLISTVTNLGLVRFMIYEEPLTAAVLIVFLSRLLQGQPKKIFLILDNLRVHRSRKVQQWLETHRERIEVFYLPAYSPELNPDELLNSDLKGGLHSGLPAKTKAELKRKARVHLYRLQKRPEHIRRYFRHPKVAYAAAVGGF
jgi:transposase